MAASGWHALALMAMFPLACAINSRARDFTSKDFSVVTSGRDPLWIIQIFSHTSADSAALSEMWEDMIRRFPRGIRFGRLDYKREEGLVRSLPVPYGLALFIAFKEGVPVDSFSSNADDPNKEWQQCLNWVIKHYPNYLKPLAGTSPKAVQQWLQGGGGLLAKPRAVFVSTKKPQISMMEVAHAFRGQIDVAHVQTARDDLSKFDHVVKGFVNRLPLFIYGKLQASGKIVPTMLSSTPKRGQLVQAVYEEVLHNGILHVDSRTYDWLCASRTCMIYMRGCSNHGDSHFTAEAFVKATFRARKALGDDQDVQFALGDAGDPVGVDALCSVDVTAHPFPAGSAASAPIVATVDRDLASRASITAGDRNLPTQLAKWAKLLGSRADREALTSEAPTVEVRITRKGFIRVLGKEVSISDLWQYGLSVWLGMLAILLYRTDRFNRTQKTNIFVGVVIAIAVYQHHFLS